MIVALALAVLAPATLAPVTVELRFDQRTKTVEVWQGNELTAEYESRDGDIYRDLLDVMRDGQQRTAPKGITETRLANASICLTGAS